MKKKQISIIIALMIISIIILTLIFFRIIYTNLEEPNLDNSSTNSSFDYSLIKETNKNKSSNYLISPYSIKTVLSIIKDGTNNLSLKELNDVMGNFRRGNITSKNVVADANLLLINKKYKDGINKNYISKIEKSYDAEIKYSNITPNNINKWVDNKTNHMIPTLVDSVNPETLIEVINAISMKASWDSEFDCKNTYISEFNTIDGSIINTIMMVSNDAQYIENDTAKGIIKKYKTYKNDNHKKVNLDFVAIMPNDGIDSYIENFNNDEFRNLLSTKDKYKNEDVSLKLPRFKYNYDFNNLKDILINMGIKSIFDSSADLSKMTESNSKDLYISSINHKSYIEVNEKGTKASAATNASIDKMASEDVPIDIEFDKPFIYIIKQNNSDDILFFGVVYTPTVSNNETNFCD